MRILPATKLVMNSSIHQTNRSSPIRAIVAGGLLAGVMDLTAAIVTNRFRGIAPLRILQSIASGLLGTQSYQGGWRTALLGTFLHFVITFTATAVYFLASRRIGWLLRHPFLSGAIYGVAIYWFMNLVVLPLSAFPHRVAFRPALVVTGLVVHILCVGLPIALIVRRYSRSVLNAESVR